MSDVRSDARRGRTVFLDRDGVINVYNANYIRSLEDFVYYDHTEEAFRVLAEVGLPIVVVTNQSGVARGYQPAEEVDETHRRLCADAAGWGAPIAAVEICPHLPTDGCECRKPGRGMFDRAVEQSGVALAGYMVGDSPSDMSAGAALGLTTLRVATGRGAEPIDFAVDHEVPDLLAAARRIQQLEITFSEEDSP